MALLVQAFIIEEINALHDYLRANSLRRRGLRFETLPD